MSTIFRKIINGEIPSYKVYEDEHTLAFLDIQPIAKGHTLVIPKVDAVTLLDLTEEQTAQLFLAVKRTMERIQETLNPDGFNIALNQKEAGGQEIPHVHVHILPRYNNDGGKNIHAIINNNGGADVKEIAQLFAHYA